VADHLVGEDLGLGRAAKETISISLLFRESQSRQNLIYRGISRPAIGGKNTYE
jgi:hypothetical protein